MAAGILATTCLGCGSRHSDGPTTVAASGSLFGAVQGTHKAGELLIDEVHGMVGDVTLGSKLSAARRALPHDKLWSRDLAGYDLVYCNIPRGDTCHGGSLWISAFDPNPAAGSHVNVILLEAGSAPELVRGTGRGAVTARGVHLGDPEQRVRARYKVRSVGPSCDGVGPGSTYYAAGGRGSIAFVTDAGHIVAIALLQGARRLCY